MNHAHPFHTLDSLLHVYIKDEKRNVLTLKWLLDFTWINKPSFIELSREIICVLLYVPICVEWEIRWGGSGEKWKEAPRQC